VAKRKPKILLVEPDAGLLELLASAFSRHVAAQVTCVNGASCCLDVEVGDPHDLVVVEWDLPDGSALDLAEQLATFSTRERPVVLLAHRPTSRQIIRAMRLGVRDVFCKPFPLPRFLARCRQLLGEYDARRRHCAKYTRVRELLRYVIRERRELNRRTEFVCRDLVGAHRRLVHRVLAVEGLQGN